MVDSVFIAELSSAEFKAKVAAGAPVFAKTACAGSPAALAAACPKPAPATVAPAAACVVAGTKTVVSTGQASSGHVKTRASTHRRVQVARRTQASGSTHYDDRVAKSGEVTSLGIEYARVGEELAGGPGYHGDYERRESYGRFEQAPPPPPPLVRRGQASAEYSERSRQSSSYSESYSSSSRGGYGRAECDCGGRGLPPHSPFDRYGYLTWRGKTPG